MAKRYIPGISGLLTEPNPTDSPSNTLSEAENVIVDQRGKVQARHGFNINQNDSTNKNSTELNKSLAAIDNLKGIAQIVGKKDLSDGITLTSNTYLYIGYRGAYTNLSTHDIFFLSGTYTLTDIVNNINDHFLSNNILNEFWAKQDNNRVIIQSTRYIEIQQITTFSTLNDLLGFTPGQYSYSSMVEDSTLNTWRLNNEIETSKTDNHVPVASFNENGSFFFKFIEYQNNVNQYLSGFLVKQNHNDYTYSSTITRDQKLIKNPLSDTVYRIYQLDPNTGKFLTFDQLPYRKIDQVFSTNETLYLQTEDGLVESSVHNIFQPAYNRYFKIRWPSFPDLQYSFRKSDLFENWFYSGHKIGLRYTFYREMGYDNQENIVYESEPSRIYEIFNDGEDSVLDVQFVFNTILQANDVYKEYNDFTKLNNGRKFGILLYRTKLTPILTDNNESFPLSAEYYQCYDFISFDSIFTSRIKWESANQDSPYENYYSFDEIGVVSQYQELDTRGEFEINDVISYIPNNVENNLVLETPVDYAYDIDTITPLYNGYIYSRKNVQYNTVDIDPNDLKLAKLKITNKKIVTRTPRKASLSDTFYQYGDSFTNYDFEQFESDQFNIGYSYTNVESSVKYINTVEFRLHDNLNIGDMYNANTEFFVNIWEYEEPDNLILNSSVYGVIKLTNLIASGSCKPYNNTYDAGSSWNILSETLKNLALSFHQKKENHFLKTHTNTGVIKVTLNQVIPLIPNKKILISVKMKNIVSGHNIKIYNAPSAVSDTSALTDEQRTNEVFAWNDGNSPLFTYENIPGTGTFMFNGAFTLSRCENVYHYNLEAATFITDDMPETPTVLNTKDPLKNIISSQAVQVNVTNTLSLISLSAGTARPHGFIENIPVRFNITGNLNIDTTTTYYVDLSGTLQPGQFRIKTSLNATTPITITYSTPPTNVEVYIYQENALTRYRAFIKDFVAPLEFNDDALESIGKRLYTNANIESSQNTNLLAPKAKTIVPFKDYYIYAGIELPLTASFTVVEQAATEQLVLGLPLYTYLSAGSTRDLNTEPWIPVLKFSKVFELDGAQGVRKLFVESSLYNNRPVEVESIQYFGFDYYDTANEPVEDPFVGDMRFPVGTNYNEFAQLTLDTTSSQTIDFSDVKQYQFGATLFERPYLTLKLTSTTNEINYVNVQLTPFYNRKGYYPLYGKSGFYDTNYLQASDSINKLNYTQPTDNDITTLTAATIERIGLVPGMVEGIESKQAESDAKTLLSSSTAINNSSNKIYYNSTENTLTFNNIDKFSKDVFKEPGMMLLQVINGTTVQAYAIIHYTNITTETNATNKHVFKNVVIKYISKLGVYAEPTTANFGSISGTLYNIWFMPGTTEENIPLYAYSHDQVYSIYITHSDKRVKEFHNDSRTYITGTQITGTQYPTYPSLVFKPHKDYESPVVAVLNKDGNITFIGAALKDYGAFLEDYAWSIVESFNRELQNKGINAYLRKGAGTGQVNIIYPDGQSIELLNGLYDETTGNITAYGDHSFSPAIKKDAFTKLAVRNEKLQYAKNEIQWSRRKIPEIVALSSSFVLGKNTKEIIGAAQSVDDLYIFKEDGIFRLTDAGDAFGNSNIPALRGSSYQFSTTSICVSGNSIQEINNEIIYLDQNGFMSIIDGGIQNISGAIQRDILTLIQTTPKERIRSFKNESKSLYYCTLINEVDETLNVKSGTYVFSTKTRQWTFMDEEILDGMEDYKQRNLVSYRQKTMRAKAFQPDSDFVSGWVRYTYNSYPLTDLNKLSFEPYNGSTLNSNYQISREQHTNDIVNNSIDQYDLAITNVIRNSFDTIYNGFYQDDAYHNPTNRYFRVALRLLNNSTTSNLDIFRSYPKVKYNDIYNLPFYRASDESSEINLTIDSIVQNMTNRSIYVRFYLGTFVGYTPYFKVHLMYTSVFTGYYPTNNSNVISPEVIYLFKFDNEIPDIFYANLTNPVYVENMDIVIGVPAKITFNPESGNNPDTNKLFQEYMIHTETTNKGAAMAFKTDSRADFSQDRNFRYDANATNRNVFRTYIPTKMSRGRYLIRQVKHDVPLENLIITGQTMVMRDSDNTRVQKNGDDE